MLQLSPVPAAGFVQRLRTEAGRRTLAIGLALLIEALLLLILLSFGPDKPPGVEEQRLTVVNLDANEVAEKAAEPSRPEPEQRVAERPELQPAPEELPPQPAVPPPVMPTPLDQPPPPAIPLNPIRPAPSPRIYGPPDTGGSPSSRDSEVVGTAPNGEPLYAASWYRGEPTDEEMRGYLSIASPGWGLIACRTVPDYRVEDCVALGEYPRGSQINRAMLAAAWEFRVRPPRRGGRLLVGSWVRIRFDYGIKPRPVR